MISTKKFEYSSKKKLLVGFMEVKKQRLTKTLSPKPIICPCFVLLMVVIYVIDMRSNCLALTYVLVWDYS
jgi:hypothetical protein